METEIAQQGVVISNLIKKHILNYCVLVNFPSKFEKIKFIASGSSNNCAHIGAKFFKDIVGVDAICEYSSEFLADRDQEIDTDTLYFFISQSGETADTLEVMKIIQSKKGICFALTNDKTSKMALAADYQLDIEAGVEGSIAATKSFSASIFCVWLCALKMAQARSKNVYEYIKNVEKLPSVIDATILKTANSIDKAAEFLSGYQSFPIVGYHYYYTIAKEGALKVKETSYIDCNAYPLGEFIHGHVALLNQDMALLEIFTDDLGEYERKNLDKIKNIYKPKTVVITDFESNVECECAITFEKHNDILFKCFSIVVILQLLALKTAQKLGRDVDKPNGLSKVVV